MMNDQFTVEEVNLMCIFDTSDREMLIAELLKALSDFDDEMLDIAGVVLDKLSNMSDADFTALELYPAYEDYDEEQEV